MITLSEQIETLEYKLKTILAEVEIIRKQAEKVERNVRLTPQEAARLMGYKDRNYIYKLDIPFDESGLIRTNKLEEWIRDHKPNRLKQFQQNIKGFNR